MTGSPSRPSAIRARLTEPAPTPAGGVAGLSMVGSSVGLVAGKAVALGLGFLFWLVAANSAPPAAVGLAGAAIAAIQLGIQLALLGIGPALILSWPQHRRDPRPLLRAGAVTITLSAATVSVVGIATGRWTLPELGLALSRPAFASALLLGVVVGALVTLLDHVSMARRRGDEVVSRNTVNGLLTVVGLLLLTAAGIEPDGLGLLGVWVVGTVAAGLVGVVQLRSLEPASGRSLRDAVGHVQALVHHGLPNHALTLSERTPALVLPVVVTEVLSPEVNAYWYTAWMVAWGVYVIPVSVGVALFTESVAAPERLRRDIGRAVRVALLLVTAAGGALALLGPWVLRLLGEEYARNALGPLRLLIVAAVPLTLTQLYLAVCRGTGHVREAILVSLASSTAVIVAVLAIARRGLIALCVTWLAVQLLTGVWAGIRLTRLTTPRPEPSRP